MLGNLYKLSGNSDAMKKQYDDVIKSLNINLNQYFQAANAFISNQEFTLAEITY
jgi:hypothetical protein